MSDAAQNNNTQQQETVSDETLAFYLQNSSSTLLTERDCPVPSIDQLLATVAPFNQLAEQDTEYLIQHSRELVQARDAVRQCKRDIHGVSDKHYTAIRNRLFPLAKSGPMSQNVQNRAPFKLLESMDELGITQQLFGKVEETKQKIYQRKLHDREKRAKIAKGIESDEQQLQQQQQSKTTQKKGSAQTMSKKERKKLNKKLFKIKPREVVFVDVCGGPGGFSQAILDEVPKLPNTKVRGYGMTLDYKTDDGCDLNWYPKLVRKRNFTPTYGIDGTGSVYNPDNVESLLSICSFEKKIHFVMGDGGFEVAADQLTMQESITSRIVYSQWYIALRLLSDGGALILKLFETSSVFLRSMLTLSCLFFRKVAIVKPAHSRVVNSERYLSCTGFRGKSALTPQWLDYLMQVHARAFDVDGNSNAPFTLLPNISLVIGKTNSIVLDQILKNLEESIISTAKRQAIGLNMIITESKNIVEDDANNQNAEQDGGDNNNSAHNLGDDEDESAVQQE
jgi:23S rRNA U2552 (ribose-2'-O)-methylase RlmE/FtsJ